MKKIYLFSSVFFLSLSLCACNNTNTTVTRLQILQNPNKLEYITGELFDPTGLVLGVQFADGKTSKVTEGYTYSPTEELTEDDEEIAIRYYNKTVILDIDITVNVPKYLEINKMPDKVNYLVGEKFNSTGLELKATFEDGEEKIITKGFRCSPSSALKEKNDKIKVTYNGKYVYVPITVIKEYSSIKIEKNPDKLVYFEHEYFDPTGIILKGYFADNSSEEIINYDYSPKDRLSLDDKEIKFSYGNCSCLLPITVNKGEEHNMNHVDKVEQTCTKDGNIEYYHCTICNNNYLDEYGLEKVDNVVISKHHILLDNIVENTPGNQENHVSCSRCDYKETIKPNYYHDIVQEDLTGENENPVQGRKNNAIFGKTGSQNVTKLGKNSAGGEYVTYNYGGSGVSIVFENDVETNSKIVIKAATGWITQLINGDKPWITGDMVFNKVFDVFVNEQKINIPDDKILKGTTNKEYYLAMGNWNYISLDDVNIKQGLNRIDLISKCPYKENTTDPLYFDEGANGTQSTPALDTISIYSNSNISNHIHHADEEKENIYSLYDMCSCGLEIKEGIQIYNVTKKDLHGNLVDYPNDYTGGANNVSKLAKISYANNYITGFKNEKDYLEFNVNSDINQSGEIILKVATGCSSSDSSYSYFSTKDMILNKVCKVFINNKEININDDQIMLAPSGFGGYDYAMGNWVYIRLKNVELNTGVNVFKMQGLLLPNGNKPYYYENNYNNSLSQSTFQLDTVNFKYNNNLTF